MIQRRLPVGTPQDDYTGTWNRTWSDYKTGFGNLYGNFWLGLHSIRRILISPGSINSSFDLYIGIETTHPTDKHRCAYYHNFEISPEEEDFKLMIGAINTTRAGEICGTTEATNTIDSLSDHNNVKFSTFDHDKDGHATNIAETLGGGWWFKNFNKSNLNGENDGIVWDGILVPINGVVMAIKQVET